MHFDSHQKFSGSFQCRTSRSGLLAVCNCILCCFHRFSLAWRSVTWDDWLQDTGFLISAWSILALERQRLPTFEKSVLINSFSIDLPESRKLNTYLITFMGNLLAENLCGVSILWEFNSALKRTECSILLSHVEKSSFLSVAIRKHFKLACWSLPGMLVHSLSAWMSPCPLLKIWKEYKRQNTYHPSRETDSTFIKLWVARPWVV